MRVVRSQIMRFCEFINKFGLRIDITDIVIPDAARRYIDTASWTVNMPVQFADNSEGGGGAVLRKHGNRNKPLDAERSNMLKNFCDSRSTVAHCGEHLHSTGECRLQFCCLLLRDGTQRWITLFPNTLISLNALFCPEKGKCWSYCRRELAKTTGQTSHLGITQHPGCVSAHWTWIRRIGHSQVK